MKKRERLEVIYDILGIIRDHHNSIRSTPLLRSSNLSSARFMEYLNELKAKGMVKEIEDKEGKYVTLTDKGFKYLQRYKAIIGFIGEFEL